MEIKKLPKEAISFSCPIFWGRMRFPPSALPGLFLPSRLPSLCCGEFIRAEAAYPCRTQNRRRDVAAHLCDCLPLGAAHCPPLCGKFRTGDGNGRPRNVYFCGGISADGLQSVCLRFFYGTERRKGLRHSFAVSDTDLSHPSPADPSTSLGRGWRVDLHAGGRSSEYSALRFLLPSDEKQISLRIRRLQ